MDIKVGDIITISGVRKKWSRDKKDMVFVVSAKYPKEKKKK